MKAHQIPLPGGSDREDGREHVLVAARCQALGWGLGLVSSHLVLRKALVGSRIVPILQMVKLRHREFP